MASRMDQLLQANSVFAQSWPTPPTMVQMRAVADGALLVCKFEMFASSLYGVTGDIVSYLHCGVANC